MVLSYPEHHNEGGETRRFADPSGKKFKFSEHGPVDQYPWRSRIHSPKYKFDDIYYKHQPQISNIQPSRQKYSDDEKKTESPVKYKSAEFSIIDIPYLIDQVPALSKAPYSNKEPLITNLSL